MDDEKLDRLLQDTASLKTSQTVLANEIIKLNDKIEPILYHVNGLRWFGKACLKVGGLIVGIAGVVSCVVGVLTLLK